MRLVFDSKFRVRGEACPRGTRSRAELLHLFDVLDPYFRLLVLEERRESKRNGEVERRPAVGNISAA